MHVLCWSHRLSMFTSEPRTPTDVDRVALQMVGNVRLMPGMWVALPGPCHEHSHSVSSRPSR